jgi:hypothetical protein
MAGGAYRAHNLPLVRSRYSGNGYSGDMGNSLAPNGFLGALDPPVLLIEEPQVVMHVPETPAVLEISTPEL